MFNPYAEIEVAPLYADDQMRSRGKSVRFRNEDSEDGWHEAGVVTNDYLLVPNLKIKEVQDSLVACAPEEFEEVRVHFDGRHFLRTLHSPKLVEDIVKGDAVSFGIAAWNSYNGTRAASVSIFVNHLVCMNGMISPMLLKSYRFKHTGNNINWDMEIQNGFSQLFVDPQGTLRAFSNRLMMLKQTKVTQSLLRHLRFETFKHLTDTEFGKILTNYLDTQDYTLMGWLDACTGRQWHSESFQQINAVGRSVDATLALLAPA
jgi:hypothetical protein